MTEELKQKIGSNAIMYQKLIDRLNIVSSFISPPLGKRAPLGKRGKRAPLGKRAVLNGRRGRILGRVLKVSSVGTSMLVEEIVDMSKTKRCLVDKKLLERCLDWIKEGSDRTCVNLVCVTRRELVADLRKALVTPMTLENYPRGTRLRRK